MSHVILHGSSLEVTNVPFSHDDIVKATTTSDRTMFHTEARALKEALRSSIPSGTYFRLGQLFKEDD